MKYSKIKIKDRGQIFLIKTYQFCSTKYFIWKFCQKFFAPFVPVLPSMMTQITLSSGAPGCTLYMTLGTGHNWYHFQMAPKLHWKQVIKGSSEFLLCFGWMHDKSHRLVYYLAVAERILHLILHCVSFEPCWMPKPLLWLQVKQLYHRIQRYSTNKLYPEKLSCFNKNLVSLMDFYTYPSNIK